MAGCEPDRQLSRFGPHDASKLIHLSGVVVEAKLIDEITQSACRHDPWQQSSC